MERDRLFRRNKKPARAKVQQWKIASNTTAAFDGGTPGVMGDDKAAEEIAMEPKYKYYMLGAGKQPHHHY